MRNHRCPAVITAVLVAIAVIGACQQGCPPLSRPKSTSTPLPVVFDRGLAEGKPCLPPCWEGLLVDVSSEEEARRILQRLQGEGQIARFTCSEWPGGIECWVYRTPESSYSHGRVLIRLEAGFVSYIGGDINFDYSVQQLITLLGEPTGVYAWPVVDPQPVYYFSLLYLERGAGFEVAIPEGSMSSGVCPDTEIVKFSYFPSFETLSQYLWYFNIPFDGRYYQEWAGFSPECAR